MNWIWLRLLGVALTSLVITLLIQGVHFKVQHSIDLFKPGTRRWREMWRLDKAWTVLAVLNDSVFLLTWNILPVAVAWEYLIRPLMEAK